MIQPTSSFKFRIAVRQLRHVLKGALFVSSGLIHAVSTVVGLSVFVIKQFNTTTAPKQQGNDMECEPPECRVWPWIRDKRSSFHAAYHQAFNPD